jgi:hypothetical protein
LPGSALCPHNAQVTASQWASKRSVVGGIALVCLVAAAALWIFADNPEQNPLLAAVTRVGIVMGALWLALPRHGESVAWGKSAILLIPAIILVAVNGRKLLYLLPVAIVVALALAFLRPRSKRRNTR